MKKLTHTLTLLLLVTLLMPFTFASAAESIPSTFPAHWHTDVFPQTYWDAMDKIFTSADVLPSLIEKWEEEYTKDRGNWPYEYYVAEHALEELSKEGYIVMGFPAESDIQQGAAIELAWKQFREDAKGNYDDALIDTMTAKYTCQYRSNDMRIWVFEFVGKESESFGFCIIDAKTGEFLEHSAALGNG